MKNTFFASDFHFGHKNIVRGVSSWENKSECREFDSLEEHDSILIENINKTVKADDELWFIGDWSFGGLENIWMFRKQINCKNINLILGNHDHHIRNNAAIAISLKDSLSFTPEYPICMITDYKTDNWYKGIIKCKELFNSVQEKFIGKIGGKYMTLDHYSHRTWDKAHHGAWMLYGHSHGTLEDYVGEATHEIDGILYGQEKAWVTTPVIFKTMDVGVDTHPEFRPYHFDEIATIMKGRSSLIVDHHNSKTN